MTDLFTTYPDLEQGLLERMLRLIVRREELLGPERARLTAQYQVALGSIENELALIDIQVQRLKRRIQLIETFGGGPIDEEQLNAVIDREFHDQESQLLDRFRQTDQARELLRSPIIHGLTPQIRSAFREMMSKLHPAFHPNQTEVQQELLTEVVDAFQMSDWTRLMELYDTVHPMPKADKPMPNLLRQIEVLEQEIEAIWQERPYNQQPLLQDEVKVASEQAKYYQAIKAKKEELLAWSNHYTMLLEQQQAGHWVN